MATDRRREVRALLDAATPRPWLYEHGSSPMHLGAVVSGSEEVFVGAIDADLQLAAAAPDYIEHLWDEVDEALAESERDSAALRLAHLYRENLEAEIEQLRAVAAAATAYMTAGSEPDADLAYQAMDDSLDTWKAGRRGE